MSRRKIPIVAAVEQGSKGKPSPSPVVDPIADPHPSRRPTVSIFVKLFVLLHVVAITVWAIPNPPKAYMNGVPWKFRTSSVRDVTQSLNDGIRLFNYAQMKPSPLKYYLLPTGFWQYWDMFSPNPASIDFYGDAIIVYKDGSQRLYQYPRMYLLGIPEKYVKERYRKYFERAHDDSYQYVWPDFAQRIALINDRDPRNPPVEVKLRRHWVEIAPPGKPQSTHYDEYQYFDYIVDQQKLTHSPRGSFIDGPLWRQGVTVG